MWKEQPWFLRKTTTICKYYQNSKEEIEKARKTRCWCFGCATNRIWILSNFTAILFWNKRFALWLGHCWKCATAPSGLPYPKVTNCPCGTSRKLQGTSDSWTTPIAMDLLSLAITISPPMLFSTEKTVTTYWDNSLFSLLGFFPIFQYWN